MELGSQNHNGDGLLRPNSIIVEYMDPLGKKEKASFGAHGRAHHKLRILHARNVVAGFRVRPS